MNDRKGDYGNRAERRRKRRRDFRSMIRWIGLMLLLVMVPLAFMRWLRTIAGLATIAGQARRGNDPQARLEQEERQEFRSYVWGIGLALLLTVVPFGLVHWYVVVSRFWLLILIGAFALAQMLVHFRFFLHIGFKQKREDLQLLLFSALLLAIMVSGTIWIMASLAQRMMPAAF